MGLVAHGVIVGGHGLQKEPHIVMVVRLFRAEGGNQVPVEVEYFTGEGDDLFDPGFFAGFPQCGGQYIRTAIDVSTKLDPAIKLPMMREEDVTACPIQQPAGSGDVPGGKTSLETVGMRLNEIEEQTGMPGFPWIAKPIGFEHGKERRPVHDREASMPCGKRPPGMG